MDEQDRRRQDERIVRRAAELGHDPERVARAIDHRPPGAAEPEPTPDAERRWTLAQRLTRRFARRS